MSPDVAASIKARLLNRARERGEVFELLLVRYACERFLYRLGASEVHDRCMLKGAGLLSLWMADPYRPTRDVDLLATGGNDEASIRATMQTICRVPCPEDGVAFDLATLSVSPIRDEQKYAGQRATLRAYLGTANIRLQVDFGFGDGVAVSLEDSTLPTLIDRLPAPVVRAYTRPATVAEKFEAMVQLGRRNSRMKDFHDVWALSQAFVFDGAALREAVRLCFARRGTPWTPDVPDVMTPIFYSDADVQSRWRAYLRAGRFRSPPPDLIESVGERVREFLGPVRASIVEDTPFDMLWPAAGPWEREKGARGGRDSDD